MKHKNQKGNALWFILVAIGLLGLLTVMMSRSSSTSNETGSYEQNVIQANEILSYAKSLENAVQGLLARGCSENDLSFWHDSDDNGTEDGSDDYYNANSPTDHSCHIFDVAGSGMTWSTPNKNSLDSSESASTNFGTYVFSSKTNITNLMTSKDELLILLEWLDLNTCKAINNLLFSETTITEDNASFADTPSVDGIYDTISSTINLSTYAAHDEQPSACFSSQTKGGYHFYHALIAR